MAERLNDPDTALMLRLQRGEDAALSQLLQRNGHRVFSLAYRYTGDRDQAEDVVQETFLKVYQARERYRPDAPFGAYLLRVAANVCVSYLRRRKGFSLDDDESGGRQDPRAAQPGEGLLENELHARVREAVQALPDRQRVAILLNKFEGKDYQEVADTLGLTVPATKSLLHRARMALKDALSGYVSGGGAKPEGRDRVEPDVEEL